MSTEPQAPERIFLSPPHMTNRERDALLVAFDSNWIAPAGPALNEFESRLCSVAGTEAAVALNSGTAALHLAMIVMGIGPGDIVLAPTVTFVASANVIRYVGAIPHFIDCDPITGNIDPARLEQALQDLTSLGHQPAAVMTVDIYGSCANYSEISPICERFGVPIIEDSAEAIGATHNGARAGSFGQVGAFSFNGNKLVTTGGGGALVGPKTLIDRARHLASQARDAELHYQHSELGYAYGLSNLSASLGCSQLDRLDSMIARTRAVNRRYVEELGTIEGVEILPQDVGGRGNGWLTVAQIDRSIHRAPAELCTELASLNIEARPAWKPMHLQPLYADASVTGGEAAVAHFENGLCLPSGSSLTASDQTRVIQAFRNALTGEEPVLELRQSIDIRVEQPLQRLGNPASTS
jgi:dTDP-4-amino-4,6-dideoxygalactose transaminase